MQRVSLLATLGVVAACSEYTLPSSEPPPVFALPAELETPVREDRITQVTIPAVDVLFVIDNSGSMSDNQQELKKNFPAFMDYFLGSGLDYHIGVVSTDMFKAAESGKLQSGGSGYLWIDPTTPDPEGVFSDMALLGILGSGDEAGIAAAYAALEIHGGPGGFNEGFYREDARLDIVVVSDEQDYSNLINNAPTKDEFIDYLLGLKAEPGMVGFSSIVQIGGLNAGTRYLDVTDAVGGISWKINDDSWEQVLQLLGVQASGLKREFFLSELPVPGSIEVSVVDVDGTEYEFLEETDWTYSASRNSVTFLDYLPPPLADVNITYEALSAMESNEL